MRSRPSQRHIVVCMHVPFLERSEVTTFPRHVGVEAEQSAVEARGAMRGLLCVVGHVPVLCCLLVSMSATGAPGSRLRALDSKPLSAQGRQRRRDLHSTTVKAVGSSSCTLPSVDARPPSLHEAMSLQAAVVSSHATWRLFSNARTPAWRSFG